MKREYGTRLSIAMHVCLERDRSERVCDVIEQRGRELLMESKRLPPETEYVQNTFFVKYVFGDCIYNFSNRVKIIRPRFKAVTENNDAFWSALDLYRQRGQVGTQWYLRTNDASIRVETGKNMSRQNILLPSSPLALCNKTDKKISAKRYQYIIQN